MKKQRNKAKGKVKNQYKKKFEQAMDGQSGEMTFMIHYHFHGFIP